MLDKSWLWIGGLRPSASPFVGNAMVYVHHAIVPQSLHTLTANLATASLLASSSTNSTAASTATSTTRSKLISSALAKEIPERFFILPSPFGSTPSARRNGPSRRTATGIAWKNDQFEQRVCRRTVHTCVHRIENCDPWFDLRYKPHRLGDRGP